MLLLNWLFDDGSARPSVGRPGQNPKRAPGDVKAVLEQRINRIEWMTPAKARLLLESAPFPEALPAYDDMVVDWADRLWVRSYPRGDSASTMWYVFDSTGAMIDQVGLPMSLDVMEIGPDYVLGRHLDPNDAPEVRLYALRGNR